MKALRLVLFFVVLLAETTLCRTAADSEVQPMSQVIQLRGDTWHRTEKGLWLVKFYAPWCKHCKKMAPEYERVAAKYNGAGGQKGVSIAQVDGVAEEKLLRRYDISGYPTVLLFRDGQRLATFGSARTYDAFVAFIEEHAGGAVDGAGAEAGGGRLGGGSWESVSSMGSAASRVGATAARLLTSRLSVTRVALGTFCLGIACSAAILALLYCTTPPPPPAATAAARPQRVHLE